MTSRLPAPLALVIFAGAVAALAGGYWDDAWHTERGRDEFLIAPHIAIYAGIALAGAAASLWGLRALLRHGVTVARGHAPLVLALIGVGVTLGSGPIDNFWHEAFGRDAVIWSPPHMLGIVGTFALGVAVVSELATRTESWTRPAAFAASALVLAAAGFATVEYDTDVPQFSERWYLPVLALASSIALLLVRRALPTRWSATLAAAIYTVFIATIAAVLAIGDFPAPALPLVIAPAIALDTAAGRRWGAELTTTAFVLALYAAYVPGRNALGSGVELSAGELLTGLPVAWLAVRLVLGLSPDATKPPSRVSPSAATVTAVAISLLLAIGAVPALAHDPGQGDDAGSVAWKVAVDGDSTRVSGVLRGPLCDGAEAHALVARRAGETRRATLIKEGCMVSGSIVLPDRGRWFVYVELQRSGKRIESWIPVEAGGDQDLVDGGRYAYVVDRAAGDAIKVALGVLLYAGMLALLWAAFRLTPVASPYRRS